MNRWLKVSIPILLLGAALGFAFAARRSRCVARTAPEFVEKYARAWRTGDVDAILEMQADERLIEIARPPSKRIEELQQLYEASERKKLEQEIERGGMWARASAEMIYAGERAHQDHIHVDVEIAGARTEIVLVQRDRPKPRLLISLRPPD